MPRGLRIEDIAKRIGRAISTTYELTAQPDFPPPRERVGNVKFWAAEDVDFWRKTRVDRRKFNGRKRRRRRGR